MTWGHGEGHRGTWGHGEGHRGTWGHGDMGKVIGDMGTWGGS